MGNAEAMVTARMGVGEEGGGQSRFGLFGDQCVEGGQPALRLRDREGCSSLRCSGGREAAAQSGRG